MTMPSYRPRPGHSPDHVNSIIQREQIDRLKRINPRLTDALLSHDSYFKSGRPNKTSIARKTGLSAEAIRRGLDEMRGVSGG